MKELVVMMKQTGEIGVVTPICVYTNIPYPVFPGFSVGEDDPIAYTVRFGDRFASFIVTGLDDVRSKCEILGEL